MYDHFPFTAAIIIGSPIKGGIDGYNNGGVLGCAGDGTL
jgi:hypothetical protein